jgi:hypothetical protein
LDGSKVLADVGGLVANVPPLTEPFLPSGACRRAGQRLSGPFGHRDVSFVALREQTDDHEARGRRTHIRPPALLQHFRRLDPVLPWAWAGWWAGHRRKCDRQHRQRVMARKIGPERRLRPGRTPADVATVGEGAVNGLESDAT